MPSFFFFTEPDSLGSQSDADAFGPVVGSADTQFRVTSIHRPVAGKTPNAYAVCDGLLLAQEAGNNLINLILKPTEQPPFAFPKIKFFIYRGIQKSTLVSGNDVAPSATNDLTKSIWDSQKAKNASAGSSDSAPAQALGIDITNNGAVDDVFYRENVSYQLPLIRAGWSMGQFDPMGFGFEIMVEAIGLDPELSLVRTAANIITVAALSSSPTQAEEFEHWHDKEAILNYIDAGSFFGGFYFHTLKVKHSDGSVSTKKKNEVYDDVLKGSHLTATNDGVFFNRNRTYLDIRNEYNHSINYFKNYGTYSSTDINCAFAISDPLIARNYYASHWPLMIIDNSDLPPGNSASNKNIIRLALPDGAGDNPLPTLYISAGYRADLYPREPKGKIKLLDLNVSSGVTEEVSLATPNRDGLSLTTAISSYIRLKYFRRPDPTAVTAPVSSGTVIRASNCFDNLFAPFDMRIPFAGNPRTGVMVYDEESALFVTAEPPRNYVGRLGLATDLSYVTFFSYPVIMRAGESYPALDSFQIPGKTRYWTLSYLNQVEPGSNRTVLLKSSLTHASNNIPFLCLGRNPSGGSGSDSLNPDDLDAVTITSTQHADLLNLYQSTFANRFRTYLGITASNMLDDNGQSFVKLALVLRGFRIVDESLPTARYEVHDVLTNIRLFSNGHI